MLSKHLYAATIAMALSVSAHAQVNIGVVTSSTGALAQAGVAQKNTVPLLTARTGELTVRYIYMDDASDPDRAQSLVKKLIAENNVDAIIGPTGSASALSVLPVAAAAGVPVLAPVDGTAAVLPMTTQKKWVFKTTRNDELVAAALVERMVKMKVRNAAYIGSNDGYGENWGKNFAALARRNGIVIVANERFGRNDTSVAAQAKRIMAARPDAVLVGAAGIPAVLPQATLFDLGYKGQVFQSPGAAVPSFIEQGGNKVDGTIMAASPMLVLYDLPDNDPSRKIAEDYLDAYEKLNGSKPDLAGASMYDAGLLLERAIQVAAGKARPGTREFRKALRDALEATRDVAGTQGVYNMTPADHSGFDFRGRELIMVNNGEWRRLK